MKRHLFTFGLLMCITTGLFASRPTKTITGEITTNTTFSKDTIYILSGYVYLKEGSGAVLTVEAGGIVKGDKSTKGALIVERGCKLIANGTATNPIVFTSGQPAGSRAAGDWGGIILCGKAAVNAPGGEAQIEGGPRSFYGGKTSPDNNDNSGSLKYCRVEYGGIAFSPNNEINGITFGGVGAGTTIDYIQVSWSGDDSYEWFGGNVNCKHLIALGSVDDDFDTDYGYSGKVQFGLALRDSATADISGSKTFESDGYKDNYNIRVPNTRVVFSNITAFGPIFENSNIAGKNKLFNGGLHARRNSRISIFNSIIGGWKYAYSISQTQCDSVLKGFSTVAGTSTTGDLQFENNILVGNADTFVSPLLTDGNGPNGASVGTMRDWVTASTRHNTIMNMTSSTSKYFATELGTDNTWGLDFTVNGDLAYSNYYVMPKSGSTLLSGASFDNARLKNDAFYDVVNYRGAFGTTDWTQGWTAWDPQNEAYTDKTTAVNDATATISQVQVYPNPAKDNVSFRFHLESAENVSVFVYDLTGRMITQLAQEKLAAGIQQINASTSVLNNGVYLVKVNAGTTTQTLRLIISK